MARTAPLWLASPTRFAALKRPQARLGLLFALILLVACLFALTLPPAPRVEGPQQSDVTDLLLYESIAAGVRGGGNYYEVAADSMRAGGYPLRPFVTVRLPALAAVLALLPVWAPPFLLWLLAALAGVAWLQRLSEAVPRASGRIAAILLLLGSLLAFLQPGLVAFHEIWAGLLVALSLALRRPGHWLEAVAIALAAMLIRETAALYALVMLGAAWLEGERREAFGWGAALLVLAAVLGVHAWAVAGVTGPLDAASPGWSGFHGFGLFVKALALATSLDLLPLWAGSLLVGVTLLGWAAWRDPLGARMLATLAAYALAIGLFARLDTFYWGLMVAPVFLAGLLFVPDALRDLFRAALDRRRVTVTRVAQ